MRKRYAVVNVPTPYGVAHDHQSSIVSEHDHIDAAEESAYLTRRDGHVPDEETFFNIHIVDREEPVS